MRRGARYVGLECADFDVLFLGVQLEPFTQLDGQNAGHDFGQGSHFHHVPTVQRGQHLVAVRVLPLHALPDVLGEAGFEKSRVDVVDFLLDCLAEVGLEDDVGVGRDVGGRVEGLRVIHADLPFDFQLRFSFLFGQLLRTLPVGRRLRLPGLQVSECPLLVCGLDDLVYLQPVEQVHRLAHQVHTAFLILFPPLGLLAFFQQQLGNVLDVPALPQPENGALRALRD